MHATGVEPFSREWYARMHLAQATLARLIRNAERMQWPYRHYAGEEPCD